MPAVKPPANPEVFHITHVSNLPSILSMGRLLSHAAVVNGNIGPTKIGYDHIKARRRLRAVPVAAQGYLGDYVPFYFCPRSVMLFVIHKSNSASLGYTGGQQPVVHLVSTVSALCASGRPWAFTERHAELIYAQYYDSLQGLGQLDWAAISATIWSTDDQAREKKQAEFLVHDWCPWSAITRIGVFDDAVRLHGRCQEF